MSITIFNILCSITIFKDHLFGSTFRSFLEIDEFLETKFEMIFEDVCFSFKLIMSLKLFRDKLKIKLKF